MASEDFDKMLDRLFNSVPNKSEEDRALIQDTEAVIRLLNERGGSFILKMSVLSIAQKIVADTVRDHMDDDDIPHTVRVYMSAVQTVYECGALAYADVRRTLEGEEE